MFWQVVDIVVMHHGDPKRVTFYSVYMILGAFWEELSSSFIWKWNTLNGWELFALFSLYPERFPGHSIFLCDWTCSLIWVIINKWELCTGFGILTLFTPPLFACIYKRNASVQPAYMNMRFLFVTESRSSICLSFMYLVLIL